MMIVRGGGPNSGYVSTGFFGGRYSIFNFYVGLWVINSNRSYFGPCYFG